LILNKYLLRCAFTGALGGLLFGFDTAVIAGTTHALSQQFALNPGHLGFTVSIALWGTVIGAISAGSIGQKIGSRATLRIMAVLYVLSAVGCAFSWSWSTFLIARFIGGLGIGGSSVLGPVYIAELAPPKYRGRLVGLFQINIVVGILLAYASNFWIASFHLGATEWRWQLGIAALPAVLFLVMLFGIPQSARWLVTQNRLDDALQSLILVGTPDSDAELASIQESIQFDQNASAEPLFKRRYLKPILLAFGIAAFNQLSGINAVLYYLNDIFVSAGFSRLSGSLQAVIIGGVNLVATLIAMTLIDRFGRKKLLLGGCVGMALCLSGVAWVFSTGLHHELLIYFLTGYTASFALSSGSVIWVYMSEIFPTRIRVKGQALGSTTLWVLNGIISQIFPSMAAKSASLPFVVFAVVMAVQFVVVLLFFPETKGLSLEQLQHKLEINEA
jgi:SP family arabinose:H+ symporter-like MFS transporter